jgi:Uma2 family endonuclease
MREIKMPGASRLVTAAELERFPSNDRRYELFEGRLVARTPVGYLHGRTVVRFGSMLERHARERQLGDVLTEVGVVLKKGPDTVFAPDLAFIKRERVALANPRGFWQGAVDLAVEVLSPEDRPIEVREKVAEYLRRGTPLVLVIDPEKRVVVKWIQSSTPVMLTDADVLDLSKVIDGFTCSVREIFD